MAFKFRFSEADSTPSIEYVKATDSESYTMGEALTLSAGKLTKCGATTKPSFISATTYTAKAGDTIPAIRIQDYMVFTAPLSASGTSLNVGDKVTLHTDGLKVTATTSSGVAEIVALDGTASGDTVAVRF